MAARQSAARATYASILRFLEQAEVFVANDRKPDKIVAPLCARLIRGASIRSAEQDGKDKYGPRIKVKIKGVPFEVIFDPHYFVPIRLAELAGIRFVLDNEVKDNVSAKAAERVKIAGGMPDSILMAAPEESPYGDRDRQSLLRLIAGTKAGFLTRRGRPLGDHRRATLITESEHQREGKVPAIARSKKNRKDIIEFVISVATSKAEFSDTLPNLGMTVDMFETQFRRSLVVADAMHEKLFPRTPPAKV